MTVKEYLVESVTRLQAGVIRPRAVCADGLKLSIQASHLHHSYPQKLLADGEYETVEVALIISNEHDRLRFEKYSSCIDEISTSGDVSNYLCCSYVNMRFMEQFVKEHGGIVDTFNKNKGE